MMGKELREQIIADRERGVTVAELSRIYGVSMRSICKLQAQYRRTGDVTPQTHTRGSKSKIDEQTLEKSARYYSNSLISPWENCGKSWICQSVNHD